MTAETHREAPDLKTDGAYFLEILEIVRDDPHETLITMQAALDIDIGRKMGFHPNKVRDYPDAVRDAQLSLNQYEAIMSLSELMGIYIEHGSYSPREVGGWLIMGPKKPIDILFVGFNRGFSYDSLEEAAELAKRFFLRRSGYKAIQSRWGN